MSVKQKVAQNTIIQIIGRAITISVALFGFSIMTRYLGQEGFGFYTTVYGFLAIFSILTDLGLQMTTTKLIADPNNDESVILSNALGLRLTASILFLGAAPLVILLFPYNSIVKTATGIATLGFIFASLNATMTSFFQKHLQMKKVVIAETIGKVSFLSGVLLSVQYDAGLYGIIIAMVSDVAITTLLLWTNVGKKITLRLSFDFTIWKKILLTTWPLAITIALNLIYFKGDIVIMSLLQPQAAVGLYGAPYRILEVLINLCYIFLGLLLPLFAAAIAQQQLAKLKRMIQTSFDALLVAIIPLIIGGVFVGVPLMSFLAGTEFILSGELIKILLLATGMIFIAGLFGYVVVALGAQKQMIKFYAANAVISVIGYTLAIYHYSYWGAAWMTVISETIILLTAGYVMYRHTNFLPKPTLLPKIIFATALMSLALLATQTLHVLAQIIIGCAIYITALYAVKAISPSTIKQLLSKA